MVAIAAIAISLNVAFHEGVHALTCVGVGSDLQEYSALHVECNHDLTWQRKVEAGSASVANLMLGTIFWIILRRSKRLSSNLQFFVWLFMVMNWLYGAGYWMFSGIANVGDWSIVIRSWEPPWLWRSAMVLLGSLLFLFFVWQALRELGRIIGGRADEQIGRANKIGILSYVASLGVVAVAGLFHPYGFFSLPVMAGLLAVAGGLSPLLWMMQWFRASMFEKVEKPPLEINREWRLLSASILVTLLYTVVLGRTLYF